MSIATDMLNAYIAAEIAVTQFQEGTLNGRRVTRADLAEIRKGRSEWQRIVDSENRQIAGRKGPRILTADFSQ